MLLIWVIIYLFIFWSGVQSKFDLQTGADIRIYDESHNEIDQDLLEELS